MVRTTVEITLPGNSVIPAVGSKMTHEGMEIVVTEVRFDNRSFGAEITVKGYVQESEPYWVPPTQEEKTKLQGVRDSLKLKRKMREQQAKFWKPKHKAA